MRTIIVNVKDSARKDLRRLVMRGHYPELLDAIHALIHDFAKSSNLN